MGKKKEKTLSKNLAEFIAEKGYAMLIVMAFVIVFFLCIRPEVSNPDNYICPGTSGCDCSAEDNNDSVMLTNKPIWESCEMSYEYSKLENFLGKNNYAGFITDGGDGIIKCGVKPNE